jgi:hypothetical protein
LRARLASISPDAWALIAIAAAVVFANVLYILGVFDANPLALRSSVFSALTPGPGIGGPTIDPSNGFISQALGHRAALDLLHLKIPWWNPYAGTGSPLIGEMESASLFPLTVLLAIANGQLYEHMLLELIAGGSTYLLLRRLAVGRPAAAAGGIAFALNGTFAWFAHAPVNVVPFLPLALLGVELMHSAAAEGRRGGWWLLAIAGALSVYGGFPEVAYSNALLVLAWVIWRGCALPADRRWRFVRKVLAGGLGAVLLAAPELVPFIDFLGHADVGPHAHSLNRLHISPQGLSQLIMPYVYGPIFAYSDPSGILNAIWGSTGGYLSTSLVLFGLLGLASRGRRGLRITLAVWLVLALSKIYGEPPGIGSLLSLVPGMSHVYFFRFAWATIELPVIVLVAIGIDQFRLAPDRRRTFAIGGLTLALVAVAAFGAMSLAHSLGATNAHRWFSRGSVAWGAGVVVAGTVLVLVAKPAWRTGLAAALVTIDVLVMFMLPVASAPRKVTIDNAPVAFLRAHLGESRFFTLGPLQPNYGSYYALGELDINDVPIPSLFADYITKRLDHYVGPLVFVGNGGGGRSLVAPSPVTELLKNLPGYRAAAVKYVLAPIGQTLPESPKSLQLVLKTPSAWIYHLTGSSPYFTATGPGCTVSSSSRTAATVTCSHATTLVRRETSMPGWSATTGGRSLPVSTYDDVFQSVTVPAGSHTVTFDYVPPDVALAVLAFIAGIGWIVWDLAGGRILVRVRRRTA